MTDFPLLSILIITPLIGSLVISLIKGQREFVDLVIKRIALITSLVTFFLSIILWFRFNGELIGFQFIENKSWIRNFNIHYHLGIDGISIFFIILSVFLTPLCILASWNSIQYRVREYMISFLVLESLMIGMFSALDLVLFYVFFEGVLIPMVLIIGIWGGERRIYSAFKFFLYTLLGSVFMLIAIIAIYYKTGSTNLVFLKEINFPLDFQKLLWLCFFVAFAVKIPMFPVHTWLPDAHVEAPTSGSVILAGVLLKMGGYGLLRFLLPLFPEASIYYTPLVIILSLVAIIYTSIIALVQKDIKKLIAYSSIAHMGFVTLGVFTLNHQAIVGAIFQMLSHGIVSSALFLCVGVIYDRFHTREIRSYGGLVSKMPQYAFFFMLFTLASLGLPGTSGFIGEFLVLLGTFAFNNIAASLAVISIVLGAVYSLWLYRRIIFGPLNNQLKKEYLIDLTWREKVIFSSLAFVVIISGFQPQFFLETIDLAVKPLSENILKNFPNINSDGILPIFKHYYNINK